MARMSRTTSVEKPSVKRSRSRSEQEVALVPLDASAQRTWKRDNRASAGLSHPQAEHWKAREAFAA